MTRAGPRDLLSDADDPRHPPRNFRNGLQYIPVKWLTAAKKRQTPYPVFNLEYAARPVQASDGPGDFLVKPRMPYLLVREQLRLKDCAVALTDQVIAPWLVNGPHPIEVLQPTLAYSPGMAGADLAEWTFGEFVRLYHAGRGAQGMSQIIQRT